MHILFNFSLELDEKYIVAFTNCPSFSASKMERDCSMHSASFLLQISNISSTNINIKDVE